MQKLAFSVVPIFLLSAPYAIAADTVLAVSSTCGASNLASSSAASVPLKTYSGAQGEAVQSDISAIVAVNNVGCASIAPSSNDQQMIANYANYIAYSANKKQLENTVRNYIASEGVNSAVLTMSQYVTAQKSVACMEVIHGQSPKSVSLGCAVIREDRYLDATYIPKAVASSLPVSFAYPNAGKIQYRVLDKNKSPLTPYLYVDVDGAYDEPDTSKTPGVKTNMDSLAQCLMSNDTASMKGFSCPAGVTTLKDLALANDANIVTLSYGRTIKPVYEPVDASCDVNANPSCALQPKIQIDVNARSVTSRKYIFFIAPYGKATFTVSGNVSYVVQAETSNYMAKIDDLICVVDMNGVTACGNGAQSYALSLNAHSTPTQAFSKTVEVPDGTSSANLASKVINPFTGADPAINLAVYNYDNDVVNRLAPNRYCYAGNCPSLAPIVTK